MIKLELSDEMVTLIGRALSELPYRVVASTIDEIQRQIAEQEKEEDLDVEE